MTETVAGVMAAVIFFVAPCKAPPAGAGIQAFVCARTLLFKHFGLFSEYKFMHSRLDGGIASGRANKSENAHHLVEGTTIPLSLV